MKTVLGQSLITRALDSLLLQNDSSSLRIAVSRKFAC